MGFDSSSDTTIAVLSPLLLAAFLDQLPNGMTIDACALLYETTPRSQLCRHTTLSDRLDLFIIEENFSTDG